ncbi:MAG: LamG domain-containing protein [Candidatus Aenigmatarchaeota archaeon]
MKAITPVISLIMLLLISVGLVGASYVWFSGFISSSTKKAITIMPGGAYCSNGDIRVYILNNGDTAITTQDILVAQVDGNSVLGTPFFGDMSSGLVGYWKFDEASGATAADSSGNGNNGNLMPSCPDCPVQTAGLSKNALKFDGDNDYVSVGNPTSLQMVNNFVVMMWINLDAIQINSFYDPISHGHDSTRGWVWQGSGTALSALFGDGTLTAGPTFSIDLRGAGWHHLTAVKSATDGVTLYLDGKRDNTMPSKTGSIVLFPGSNLEIGKDNNVDREAKGLIDDVKIYNRAVGDLDIQPSRSKLVVFYPAIAGRHTIRIATSSNAAETSVTC